MKILYLECSMGAAGDMLMGALYELLEDKKHFLEIMNGLLPGVSVTPRRTSTCGISGTHMEVSINGTEEESLDEDSHMVRHTYSCDYHTHDHHDHEHHHTHVHRQPEEISKILEGLDLPEKVRMNAKMIYERIAEAEAKAHGVPVEEIHFHEVGNLDAIADVVGVCLAMHMLFPDRIISSPVHMGSGQVRCAHGTVSVPAPATANLLQGVPCYSSGIQGELCTPTGAALIAHFAEEFCPVPVMKLEGTGYGVGKKVFSTANCVRAFLGEADDPQQADIVELCCHIDDMTAEALAFAGERLLDDGALDISTSPITMKKGRAGIAFTVLCKPKDEERIARKILFETNTNGLRVRRCKKYILTSGIREIETSYGPVRIKCAEGLGIYREKPEYEDVASIAKKELLPFDRVWKDILIQMEQDKKRSKK